MVKCSALLTIACFRSYELSTTKRSSKDMSRHNLSSTMVSPSGQHTLANLSPSDLTLMGSADADTGWGLVKSETAELQTEGVKLLQGGSTAYPARICEICATTSSQRIN